MGYLQAIGTSSQNQASSEKEQHACRKAHRRPERAGLPLATVLVALLCAPMGALNLRQPHTLPRSCVQYRFTLETAPPASSFPAVLGDPPLRARLSYHE